MFDNLVSTGFCCISVGAIHESPVYKIKQNLIFAIRTQADKIMPVLLVKRAIHESPLQKSNQIQFIRIQNIFVHLI